MNKDKLRSYKYRELVFGYEFNFRLVHSKYRILSGFQNSENERYSKEKIRRKGDPAQAYFKINLPVIGLFFCAKFYCRSF